MSKWISVKDRLPDKRGAYLVSIHTTNHPDVVLISHFNPNNKRFTLANPEIIAWQKLPEPYKEIDNE